jgi:hypothetical protein
MAPVMALVMMTLRWERAMAWGVDLDDNGNVDVN